MDWGAEGFCARRSRFACCLSVGSAVLERREVRGQALSRRLDVELLSASRLSLSSLPQLRLPRRRGFTASR